MLYAVWKFIYIFGDVDSYIGQSGITKDGDQKLGNFSSTSVMIKNGWMINCRSQNNPYYNNMCQKFDKNWFGYTNGDAVGSVGTTFSGNGNATLKYGNCFTKSKKGQVKVELNGKEISSANQGELGKEIIFNFSKGDQLEIKEVNTAIIKLNSLEIEKK